MNSLIKKRKSKKRKVFIFSGIFLVLFTLASAHIWYRQQLLPIVDSADEQYFTINQGMSSAAIARALADEGIIRNPLAFRIHARIEDASHRLQAGFYALSPAQSTPQVLTALTGGAVAENSIRIPGGYELSQIIEVIEEAGFSRDDIELALGAEYDYPILRDKPRGASLEGYLFPDTYVISGDMRASDFIDMVLANTQKQVDESLIASWAEYGLNIHEGFTLASIIQKEVPSSGEKEVVSQVFHLRLETGMMLQADPTYLYGARRLGVSASPNLNSPYNTYRNEGLPPGPIGSVELSALEASANPSTSTQYLYFVTGDDGVTRFSETQEQHDSYIRQHGISGT